nr:MAG TPA: hypothetical protein [Caudoviricetes sp.]
MAGLYRYISNNMTSRAWIKTLDNIYSCRRLTLNRCLQIRILQYTVFNGERIP